MKMTISIDDNLAEKVKEYAKNNYTSQSAVFAQGARSIIMQDAIMNMFSEVAIAIKKISENNTMDEDSQKKLDDFMYFSKQLLASGSLK